jgi:hypothetical protein
MWTLGDSSDDIVSDDEDEPTGSAQDPDQVTDRVYDDSEQAKASRGATRRMNIRKEKVKARTGTNDTYRDHHRAYYRWCVAQDTGFKVTVEKAEDYLEHLLQLKARGSDNYLAYSYIELKYNALIDLRAHQIAMDLLEQHFGKAGTSKGNDIKTENNEAVLKNRKYSAPASKDKNREHDRTGHITTRLGFSGTEYTNMCGYGIVQGVSCCSINEGAKKRKMKADNHHRFFPTFSGALAGALTKLTATTLARGASLRGLQLGDLFSMCVDTEGPQECPLVASSLRTKTTGTGKTSVHWFMPHVEPICCCHFAIGYLWFVKHVVHDEAEPDWRGEDKGWKDIFLFPGFGEKQGKKQARNNATDRTSNCCMTYNDHYNLILPVYNRFCPDVLEGSNSVTHLGRKSGSQILLQCGVDATEVERHGGWRPSESSVVAAAHYYMQGLSYPSVRVAAGLSASGGGFSHGRYLKPVPSSFLRAVVPGLLTALADEEAKLDAWRLLKHAQRRKGRNGVDEPDYNLINSGKAIVVMIGAVSGV